MTIWFTSDTHYFHRNIIDYCGRPFDTVEEMNETLVANWNDRVQPNETVYHIGDVSFGKPEETRELLSRLKGRKVLIRGNHDSKRHLYWDDLFENVYDYREVRFGGKKIVLCHYAFKVWNSSHHGAWHLYGHSHGTLADDPNSLSWDVGVDNNDFKPISFEEVETVMERKVFVPIDHHEPNRGNPDS